MGLIETDLAGRLGDSRMAAEVNRFFIVNPIINYTLIAGGVSNPEETPKQKPCNGEVCCSLKCKHIFGFYYNIFILNIFGGVTLLLLAR